MGFGKYLGLLGGIGGGIATGAIGKHGIDPKYFAMMGGLGGLAGMAGAFSHHGGGDHGNDQMAPGAMPQDGPQMMPQAMPGQMGQVSSPMQQIPQGQPQAPTGFAQPSGMFGGGADPRQAMMQKYRQWQMLNQGGGY